MIAYLKGRIISKRNGSIIIDVKDVGYQVALGESLFNELLLGSETELYTYHHVREEASDLYGFKSVPDLEIFEMLLSVSGVGPKSALGVLSVATYEDVVQAILRGDPNLLTKVSGIGKKTAERIVLELKTKIVKVAGSSPANGLESNSYGSDEIDALMSLGYSLSEARAALGSIANDLTDSGVRVKAALKMMKKS